MTKRRFILSVLIAGLLWSAVAGTVMVIIIPEETSCEP